MSVWPCGWGSVQVCERKRWTRPVRICARPFVTHSLTVLISFTRKFAMLVFFETAHHCVLLFACLLARRQTAGKQASTAFAGKSDEQIYWSISLSALRICLKFARVHVLRTSHPVARDRQQSMRRTEPCQQPVYSKQQRLACEKLILLKFQWNFEIFQHFAFRSFLLELSFISHSQLGIN